MAESTLSVAYAELMAEIGYFIGKTRDSTRWSADDTQTIQQILKSGLNMFYFPQILEGQSQSHRWSFLSPVTTLSTIAEQEDYDLPDDFGTLFHDKFSYPASNYYPDVLIVSDVALRDFRGSSSGSSYPCKAAIVPKSSDGSSGQRFQVQFWPTPNAIYTLTYRYNVLPNMLTTVNGYPLGGAVHAETIKQACLAAAERKEKGELGVENAEFIRRLTASIGVDRRLQPRNLGYNGDRSQRGSRADRSNYVTYNDTLYP